MKKLIISVLILIVLTLFMSCASDVDYSSSNDSFVVENVIVFNENSTVPTTGNVVYIFTKQ